MDSSRKKAWIIAAISLTVLVGASLLMTRRVARFHEEHPRHVYAFQPIDMREFKFGGKPVILTDDQSDAAHPKLVVTYADDSLTLDAVNRSRWDLPDLKSHEDWLKILRFAPRSGMTTAEFTQNLEKGTDRLVIVTRKQVEGVNPETWGKVWKKNWVFDFYELMPEGGFMHQTLAYPTTRGIAVPKEGELRENTWEFQAALQLMPQAGGVGPTHNFYGDALAAASWTLPLAAFSGLVAAVAIAFGFAPPRRHLA